MNDNDGIEAQKQTLFSLSFTRFVAKTRNGANCGWPYVLAVLDQEIECLTSNLETLLEQQDIFFRLKHNHYSLVNSLLSDKLI